MQDQMCDKTNKKDDAKKRQILLLPLGGQKLKFLLQLVVVVFDDGFKSLIKHLINAFFTTEGKVLH